MRKKIRDKEVGLRIMAKVNSKCEKIIKNIIEAP